MTENIAQPTELSPTTRARDYAKCGWLFVGLAAIFGIAPAKGIGLIVLGFLLGAAFSFLAYGASRLQKSRIAVVLFVFGLLISGFFFIEGPAIHRNMMSGNRK